MEMQFQRKKDQHENFFFERMMIGWNCCVIYIPLIFFFKVVLSVHFKEILSDSEGGAPGSRRALSQGSPARGVGLGFPRKGQL